MFNKFMNNYYFGKSGKGDMTVEDLPATRWQLFMEMLRVRFSALMRLNLLYMLIWLPTMIVVMMFSVYSVQTLNMFDADGTGKIAIATQAQDGTEQVEEINALSAKEVSDNLTGFASLLMLALIPCIGITGPFTAGVSYVTRNWSRDEHAFIWSDFKDAVKENWKQSLVISLITGVMPFIVYTCWRFYGGMAADQAIMVIPQVLTLMIGLIWALAVTYAHPLIVTYKLRLRDVLRNSLLLAIARLPMSVGIRLLHSLPMLLGALIGYFIGGIQWVIMVLFLYYLLLGFALSRFVTASYTNGVFDKYINPRIEGAQVNRGLREQEDDDEDDEDEEEDE